MKSHSWNYFSIKLTQSKSHPIYHPNFEISSLIRQGTPDPKDKGKNLVCIQAKMKISINNDPNGKKNL